MFHTDGDCVACHPLPLLTIFVCRKEIRLRVVPLLLSPSSVTGEKIARKKWRVKSWEWEACEMRDYWLSQRVWPFTAEWFFGVNFLIVMSCHYRRPGRWSLWHVAIRRKQSKHAARRMSLLSEISKEVVKGRPAKEASCNDFCRVCRCNYRDFKRRVSTENFKFLVFEISGLEKCRLADLVTELGFSCQTKSNQSAKCVTKIWNAVELMMYPRSG